LLFLAFKALKNAILTNFCNPEIPGLATSQSRDTGLAKTALIPNPFGIPGLQSLDKSAVFWLTVYRYWVQRLCLFFFVSICCHNHRFTYSL